MDAIDACYYYAGMIGVLPNKTTLRRLWQMADARIRQTRYESVQLASLVWGMSNLDIDAFIHYGEWVTYETGGKPEFSPDFEAKIQAEMERLRKGSKATENGA